MNTTHMSAHHGMHWAPESRVGMWSVALAAGAAAGLVLSVVGFATGVLESASSFSDNWLLTGWGLAILASGAAAGVTGALALIRRHDRSWTVMLATCLGLLAVAVTLNEIAQGL